MWESLPEPIHLKILAIIDRYENGEKRREEAGERKGERCEVRGERERRGGSGEVRCWRVSRNPFTSRFSTYNSKYVGERGEVRGGEQLRWRAVEMASRHERPSVLAFYSSLFFLSFFYLFIYLVSVLFLFLFFPLLHILFRLLDRALMHVDSPAFWALNNWLDHVEKTLNPYKKYSPSPPSPLLLSSPLISSPLFSLLFLLFPAPKPLK